MSARKFIDTRSAENYLWAAISQDNPTGVEEALDAGASPNLVGPKGNSLTKYGLLAYAVFNGSHRALDVLLKRGVRDRESRLTSDMNAASAVLWACRMSSTSGWLTLARHKPKLGPLWPVDKYGRTPLSEMLTLHCRPDRKDKPWPAFAANWWGPVPAKNTVPDKAWQTLLAITLTAPKNEKFIGNVLALRHDWSTFTLAIDWNLLVLLGSKPKEILEQLVDSGMRFSPQPNLTQSSDYMEPYAKLDSQLTAIRLRKTLESGPAHPSAPARARL